MWLSRAHRGCPTAVAGSSVEPGAHFVVLPKCNYFFVFLRYAGHLLGSFYAMQVKFEVLLRYTGQFLGSVYALQMKFGVTLCRSIFGVCPHSAGEICGPSTLCRSFFLGGGLSRLYK